MSKQALAYISAFVLFTGCDVTTQEETAVKEQIDSAVRAREEQLRNELKLRNDSIIRADALRRADSIMGIEATIKAQDTAMTPDTTLLPPVHRPNTPPQS